MKNIEAPINLTIGDNEYPVSSFSETVQRLVEIHTLWRNQLQNQRVELSKTEAALKSLDNELSELVVKELTEAAVAEKTDERDGEAADSSEA